MIQPLIDDLLHALKCIQIEILKSSKDFEKWIRRSSRSAATHLHHPIGSILNRLLGQASSRNLSHQTSKFFSWRAMMGPQTLSIMSTLSSSHASLGSLWCYHVLSLPLHFERDSSTLVFQSEADFYSLFFSTAEPSLCNPFHPQSMTMKVLGLPPDHQTKERQVHSILHSSVQQSYVGSPWPKSLDCNIHPEGWIVNVWLQKVTIEDLFHRIFQKCELG